MSSGPASRKGAKPKPPTTKSRPAGRVYILVVVAAIALAIGVLVFNSADKSGATAEQANGVQTASVAVGATTYEPGVVYAKAGIPLQITFGQGGGCTAEVQFPQFGVFEDLTAGPKTISLPAMEPGEYGFACGMNMASGKVVVR